MRKRQIFDRSDRKYVYWMLHLLWVNSLHEKVTAPYDITDLGQHWFIWGINELMSSRLIMQSNHLSRSWLGKSFSEILLKIQIFHWRKKCLWKLYQQNIRHFVQASMHELIEASDAYMHWYTSYHWFRQWLVAWSIPSHYLNQCWNIVNLALSNKFQLNFNRNSYIFIEENAFEMVVWQTVAILSQPQCVKYKIMKT